MTLKLKTLLTKIGANQTELAARLEISRAAMNQIINRNVWPKGTQHGKKKADIKNEIGMFLQERGAAPAEIAAAFKKTESSRTKLPHHRAKTPSGTSTSETLEETMLLRKQGLTPDARKYFDLPRDPFSGDVQAHDDVFVTPDIRYVREAMFQAARHGGFMAVVGESGSGKSTLRRDLVDRIQRESHPVILIEPYVLGMEDNDVKGKTLIGLRRHWQEDDAWFCSELIAWAAMQAGTPLLRTDHWRITPRDLALSPLLREIDG